MSSGRWVDPHGGGRGSTVLGFGGFCFTAAMSSEPLAGDTRALMLTSFAAAGDVAGVRRVLAADPGAVNELGLDGTSPLCAAAMWGQVGWML